MEEIIQKIRTAISGTEFSEKTYAVGGYVRDLIMKRDTMDLDLVVELPEGGRKLAEYLFTRGICTRPVEFDRFGTATVIISGRRIEMVMTRKESYHQFDRKPEVAYGSLQEDIQRRDFTINTLLMSLSSGEILDLTNQGRQDIEKKVIRGVGNPDQLFTDDPLRLLRAVRFSQQLGFKIESATRKAIISHAALLNTISWERKRDEFVRIILTSHAVRGIRQLEATNLLTYLIPELLEIKNLEQDRYHHQDAYTHTLAVLARTPPRLETRLAALLHDIGKGRTMVKDNGGIHFPDHDTVGSAMTDVILKRFRFPGRIRQLVVRLVKDHMMFKQAGSNGEKLSEIFLFHLLRKSSSEQNSLLDLVNADNVCRAPEFRLPHQILGIRKRLEQMKNSLTSTDFPVKGKDIIEYFGIDPGEKVGILLAKARKIWLDQPESDSRLILNELQKEEEMEEKESKVTEKVREGVTKAYELGEDLVQALTRITKEVIHTAKDEELSTKEKLLKLANEALEGAKQGAKAAQPTTEEFLKKASKVIGETIKENAPKVASFTQDALKGFYEGARDVYVSKKPQSKKPCCKDEKE